MLLKKNILWDELIKRDKINLLLDYKVGLEREALRVDLNGKLSKKPHPQSLGSPLTNKNITTDFSEAQIELVSDVHSDIDSLVTEFEYLHKIVQKSIGDEILWANSMPCQINSKIPLAEYGSSNIAKFKKLYRLGLANRYGKKMQLISGIHFNFSFNQKLIHLANSILKVKNDDTKDSNTRIHIARNLFRLSPFTTFFLGNSFACDESFTNNSHQSLIKYKKSIIGEKTTSIRMGDIGYVSSNRCHVELSLDSINMLIEDYKKSLNKECIDYKLMQSKSTLPLQLNSNVLQIEAEYYSIIRPKSDVHKYGSLIAALENVGITYLEHRGIDIDESITGISDWKLYFIHLLFTYSLISESPNLSKSELREIKRNQRNVAMNGNDEKLNIKENFTDINFKSTSKKIIDELSCIAKQFDQITSSSKYKECIDHLYYELNNKSIHSTKIIQEIKKSSFQEYSLNISKEVKTKINDIEIPAEIAKKYEVMTKESLLKQKEIENTDNIDFSKYLYDYNQKL